MIEAVRTLESRLQEVEESIRLLGPRVDEAQRDYDLAVKSLAEQQSKRNQLVDALTRIR